MPASLARPILAAALLAFLAAAPAPAIDLSAGAAPPKQLTPDDVAALPSVDLAIAFGTEHGPAQATFSGPLLWTVLTHEGLIDPAKPAAAVRQSILVTGRDGYTAILAMGEIAPAFEAKQVILAERMNGQPLAPDHLRLVVPGDRRGGRSVRDVVAIAVSTAK